METKNVEFLKRLAKGIVSVFGERCEVVIHDFADMAQSVVHIEGDVTHRSIGAPITDLVFNLLHEFGDDVPDKIGYKNTTGNGKVLKCATFFVRDEAGKPEGCLCINFDVTDFMFVSNAFSDLTFLKNSMPGEKSDNLKEHYTQSFPETMESVIDSVIADNGRLPAMMDKAERMAVVRKLNQAGVFTIKGSVNYMAKVFGASRFTIYNYLKEIREG